MTTRNTPLQTPAATTPSTALMGLIKKTGGKLGLQSGLGKKKTTADRATEAETLAALQAQDAAQTAAQESTQEATTTAATVDTSATDTSTQFSTLTEQTIPGSLTAQELQTATQLPDNTASTHPLHGSQWAQASTSAAAATVTATDAGVAAATATTAATPTFLASAWPALAIVGGGVAALASSGSSAVVAEGAGTVIKGVLVAGPVIAGNGLTIKIYDLAGKLLNSGAIQADGSYQINIGNYTGGVIVKVVDANDGVDFRDEATGAAKDLNATFMAVDVVTAANSTLNIHLNAATTIAAVKTGLSASDGGGTVTGAALADKLATIQAANAAVAAALGITSGTLTGTAATATINADGTPNANANNLGKVLAAFSGQDEANAGNMATTIANFAAAITGTAATATLSAEAQGKLIAGATAANVSGNQLAAILSPAAAAAATALGTLDAAEVAALTPAMAANLTAAQLAAAPSLAALTAAALQAISPAALAAALAATPALLATLSATQIAALSADQIAALSPTQIAALDATQVAALNGVQLQALAAAGLLDNLTAPFSAAQLTAAAPTGLGLTALGNNAGQTGVETALFNSVLANLTDANQGLADSAAELAAMATLVDKLAQLAALDPTAAGYAAARDALGITSADFAKLGITVTDVDLASVLKVIAASANDGSGITSFADLQTLANAPAAAAAMGATLDANEVASLSPAIASLLTGEQVASIASLTSLSPALISALAPSALDDVTFGQLSSLGPEQLAALTGPQLSALATAGKLGAIDLAGVGNGILGLTDAQLANLTADQLDSLTGPQVASLAAAGKFALETSPGVRLFPNLSLFGTDIQALTATQVPTLNSAQLASLTLGQVALLDGNTPSSLTQLTVTPTGNQILALGTNIAGISAATLALFSTAQLDALSSTQIGALASASPSRLTGLSAAQITALGTDINGLTAAQINLLSASNPNQLSGISASQASVLANGGKLDALSATNIMALSDAAIGSVGANYAAATLSAAQLGNLSPEQQAGLTKAQVTAFAASGKLGNLEAADINAIGTDITGLNATQINALTTPQLGGLNATQINRLASDGVDGTNPAGDLSLLTGVKLQAITPAAIAGLTADQLKTLTNVQLTDLTPGQVAALASASPSRLTALTASQITALDPDISALTAAQINALSTTQLGGLDNAQAEAIATAGGFANLSGANVLALSVVAIDNVPTNVIDKLSPANVAALSLVQVQALTAPQLQALNAVGLLDDLTQNLTSTQITALGFTGVNTADEMALFNSTVQSASGATALDLTAAAAGVEAVLAAVGAGTGTVSVANLQALGLTGVSNINLAAIQAALDAITDPTLVDSINELRALVVNASGEMGNAVLNAAELADGTPIAVALPTSLASPTGASVVLHIPLSGTGTAQSITHNLTQADIDRGYALVTVSQAQALAAGDGTKAATFDVVVNGSNQVTGASVGAPFNLQLGAPVLTGTIASDNGTHRISADLSMAFDETVVKGTGAITLYKADGTVVEAFDVATSTAITGWNSSTLLINPAVNLLGGTGYYVKVTPGAIADIFGNAYAGIADSTTWNFTGSAISVSLNAVATDNTVNTAENTAVGGVVISGTLQTDTAGLLADLSTGSFAITLTPAGGGAVVTVNVTSYTGATGVWSGSVAANALLHGNYALAVTVTGTTGLAAGSSAVTSAQVVVDTQAPQLTATTITATRNGQALFSGAALKAGDVVTVSASYNDAVIGTLTAPTLSIGGETGIVLTAAVTSGNQRSWTYTVSNTGTTDTGVITIVGSLIAGLTDAALNPAAGAATATGTYTADTTAPVLTLGTLATQLQKLTATEAASFTQSYTTADASGVASTTVVVRNSSNTVQTGVTLTTTGGNVAGNLSSLASGNYTIEVTTTDNAGNTHVQSQAITIDKDAPTLTSSTPADNATAISSVADVVLNFADGTQTGMALGTGNITLYNTANPSQSVVIDVANHGGQLSWSGNSLTINPTSALVVGVDYAVKIDATAITDVAGNAYAGIANNTTLNFITQNLAQMFNAAGAGTGYATNDATYGTAVTSYLAAMDASVVQTDAVSANGTVNGSNALAHYVDRVTGTDIVSDTEFDAGFTLTGHFDGVAAGTVVKFFIDNDRTSASGETTEALSDTSSKLLAQTVQVDANGNWTLDLTKTSQAYTTGASGATANALLQATHGTAGSGVHKIRAFIDTDGGNDVDAGEALASRLFLVASGTAGAGTSNTDKTGASVSNTSATGNFSVQDVISKNLFTYFYGDVDGRGIGFITQMDSGDTLATQASNGSSRDNGGYHTTADWDHYNAALVAGVGSDGIWNTSDDVNAATYQNTALGYATNLAAKVWEFQIGKTYDAANDGTADGMAWSAANTLAGNHTTWGSNTSRLVSMDELLAVYAANFSGGNTPGAVEPVTPATSTVSAVNNTPGGWGNDMWSSAPTPSGHAIVSLGGGLVYDFPDYFTFYVSAVL